MRESFASGYSLRRLRADVLAGIVVGLIELPLAMALAIATGVPPQYGLYTAIVGAAVIAVTGGTKVQVSGPTAAFIVVLAPIVHEHGLGGLCFATLMAGAIMAAMGLFRLGGLINLVPYPVTTGFTLGIGCVIAIGQTPDLLGIPSQDLPPHPIPRLAAVFGQLGQVSAPDLVLGLSTLALLICWPRVTTRVPAALVALFAASLLGALMRSICPDIDFATLGSRFSYVDVDGRTVAGIPSWMPTPVLPWQLDGIGAPDLVPDFALVRELMPSAFTIAVLGGIESLLSATVADGMTGSRHDPDAELVGQGIGNMVVPFFGGFAATGAIARTAANVRAGATSPIAAISHSVFVLVSMLMLAPYLAHLPMAALAAMLMLVAWNLSEVRHVVHVVRTAPGHDVGVLATCVLLTIVFDMVVAVVVGIGLASFLFMRRMAQISGVAVVPADQMQFEGEVPRGVLVYEVAGPLVFGSAENAMSTVRATAAHVKVVILSLGPVPAIDATGVVNLRSAIQRLSSVGIVVILAGLRPQPAQALHKAEVTPEPGILEFEPSLRRAVSRAREIVTALDTLT